MEESRPYNMAAGAPFFKFTTLVFFAEGAYLPSPRIEEAVIKGEMDRCIAILEIVNFILYEC